MGSQDWRDQAVCVGVPSTVFFPEMPQMTTAWDVARRLCGSCPVREKCLEFALRYEDLEDRWGMYGGLTPNERNLIRNERRKWRP